MGCWGITAFESDTGLDAISLIRKHLPEQGDVELRQMLAWLKADSWNAPPEVSEGVSHTSPMAVAELIVKFQEKDFSALDGIRGDKKFSSLSSFTASKESLQWVQEYLSATLFYSPPLPFQTLKENYRIAIRPFSFHIYKYKDLFNLCKGRRDTIRYWPLLHLQYSARPHP